ncbi:MAG: glycoside hydrolase family 3 N-terminal domain-containing protein [Bacteroidota bacterium]
MPDVFEPALGPTTLAEQAAQLVWPRLGSNMPPPQTVEEDAARVEDLLARCPVGGLVLFNGDTVHTPAVLDRLQAASRYPLLVASDLERGAGQQLRGATVFPHARAFGALGEAAEAHTAAAAEAMAREARALGIHVLFAPVADVNRDPRNPIIATRAFSEQTDQAAALVQAFVQGAQAAGVYATAKHFPGHGNTAADSHAELPVVQDDRATLAAHDLVPFQAAIAAGVELVMTAHVAFPALDPAGLGRPATASAPILQPLLRTELGFEGVVVTDSLLMGAIRTRYEDAGAQAVALVQAGVDVLLDVAEPEAAVAGLVRAVEAGTLAAATIEAAAQRVWRLKTRWRARHGPAAFRSDAARLDTQRASHQALAQQVAQAAVTITEPMRGAWSLTPAQAAADGLAVVLLKPHQSRLDPPEEPLGAAVRSVYPSAHYHQVGPDASEADLRRLLGDLEGVGHVVVAAVVKPAAWHAFGLTAAQEAFMRAAAAQQPVRLALLGSPHGLDPVPGIVAQACTYSDVPVSQEALVRSLAAPAP